MSPNPLLRLGELGQSPWYDFITRDLVTSGELARLIAEDGLLGMTTNPTIFEKAIAGSPVYDDAIRRHAAEGQSPAQVFEALAVADVRAACDLFRPAYERTGGRDGLVSIEVAPTLANDTDATVEEAERLWAAVSRPNAMIKIPGTRAGLPAITRCIADGINVNVTLLFSVERYEEVIAAYEAGLELRVKRGLPLERVASVASFFVSRVDSKVDPLLDRLGDPAGLRGRIAVANACLAFRTFEAATARPRWDALAARGARVQRPLWASTSTKDPRYPDLHYVEPLIAPRTVTTLPPETFAAYRDHGRPEVRIHAGILAAEGQLDALEDQGIDLRGITLELEDEGVGRFAQSYRSLLASVEAKADVLTAR
ncbi:MAG TPA: transaldolase [Gemmatimonadales bacterium]|jgi:transaldolase|nr:transaldolase [Gemmatimonadales bacterium]